MIFCTISNRPEFYPLKIHHGGGLYEEDEVLSYSDGKVTYADWVNEVFGAIRTVNIYICDVNPTALKVVHPDEEEDLDVNEDSQYYEFNEEEEEMVQTESNTEPRTTFI